MSPSVTMIRRVVAALLAVVGTGAALRAQSGTTTVGAAVVSPLAVTGLAALDFGTVAPGVNRTVAWDAPTSGRFRVTGLGASQLSLTFALPSALLSGGNAMPIRQYRIRVNDVSSTASANNIPVNTGVPFTRSLVAGSLWFFVGARVEPTATQASGIYTSPVVLTAAYTGL